MARLVGGCGRIFAKALIGACAAVSMTPAAGVAATVDRRPLRLFVVDVEGGAASLYITPQGHSLLVDTGWPAGMGGPRLQPGEPPAAPTPSSAERIVAVARANGLSRIDHVLVTHYHVDHVGGLAELVTRFPVGEVIDHGPNREELPATATPAQTRFASATLYPVYEQAIRSLPRRIMAAGETLKIDDLSITAVDSDRKLVAQRLAGAGRPGAGCATLENKGPLGGEENARSLGFVATWGRARILSLGDSTWDIEQQLVCPRDRIGAVDLMFADNHGSDNSNARALLATVRPRVVLLANGPTKGAMPETMRTLAAAPGFAAVWQMHTATRDAPAENVGEDQIANPAGQPDAIHPLEIRVAKDATITVRNPRTGASKRYAR